MAPCPVTFVRTAAVGLLLLLGCELSDKQVGQDPEPAAPQPEVCTPACERQTECFDTDAYACLAACNDELEAAPSELCRDARVVLHDCRTALECDDLDRSLREEDGGACGAEVTASQAACL